MISEEELDKILNRCKSTQKGPWKAYIEGRDHTSGSNFIKTGQGKERGEDIEFYGASIEDIDFMAQAKQDIPRLIKEIKRLKNLNNDQ